jgi:hypothetical protein
MPCDILEERDDGSLDVRGKDGRRFIVGVRDDVYSEEYGWVTVFWPEEAEEVW